MFLYVYAGKLGKWLLAQRQQKGACCFFITFPPLNKPAVYLKQQRYAAQRYSLCLFSSSETDTLWSASLQVPVCNDIDVRLRKAGRGGLMNLHVESFVIRLQMKIRIALFISSNLSIYSPRDYSLEWEAVLLLCLDDKNPRLCHLFYSTSTHEINANKNHILTKSSARQLCLIGSDADFHLW